MKDCAVLLVEDNASQRRIVEFWLKEEVTCWLVFARPSRKCTSF
jgi:hypothetical protein